MDLFQLIDVLIGAMSVLLGWELIHLSRTRTEFIMDVVHVMMLTVFGISTVLFLSSAAIGFSRRPEMELARAVAFPCLLAAGAIWLAHATKRIHTFPRVVDLENANKELKRETDERKAAEVQLKNANEFLEKRVADRTKELQTLIDHSPLAIIKLDAAGKVILWNPAAASLFGWQPGEVLGKPLPIVPEEKNEEFQKYFDSTIKGESVFGVEAIRLRKEKGPVSVALWNVALQTGGERQALAMFVDITPWKEMQSALEAARSKAEEANRAKTSFLANISHEIRTPLTAILGFTELLLEGIEDEEERVSCLKTILRNGQVVNRLINDLLDISKIEAGKMDFAAVPVDVLAFFSELKATLGLRAMEKGLTLVMEIHPDVPRVLMVDPLRWRQVLLNLIGNAVKFTSHGEVRADIKCMGQESGTDGSCVLQAIIKDSGPGISPEAVERLFRPFSQEGERIARQFGGTGLGLYLSRLIARELGGDVTLVSSKPGEGSVFEAHIRAQHNVDLLQFEESKRVAQAPHPLSGYDVLLVDDSEDNRKLISRFLSKAGAKVALASDGADGVAQAASHEFDLILMDLRMPNMDGFEATEVLKKRGCPSPVVALTAHVMKNEIEGIERKGFRDLVAKPVNVPELIQKVKANAIHH